MTLSGWRRAILGLLIVVLTATVLYFKPFGIAYQWWTLARQSPDAQQQSLNLASYQVIIDAKPIVGLTRNLSGLTYNTHRHTLIGVTNRPARVVELTLDGELLRTTPIKGVRDPEGITHIRDNIFVIVDERKNGAHWVEIDANTTEVHVIEGASKPLVMNALDNLGLEGVSWDDMNQILYVVQEKWPMSVMTLSQAGSMQLGLVDWVQQDWVPQLASDLFMSDLSSITISPTTNSLLLLSDESALIAEYAISGELLGMMPLWRGQHGLRNKIPQPEGMTLGPNGDLFIVSEPNLFYRFQSRL